MVNKGYELLNGRVIRGDQLRLPRSIAIYRTAKVNQKITIKECRVNSRGDEIIIITLHSLSIPDEPVFSISKEEDVAIKCSKEDINLPAVFAIRKDFPVGLPHSNAMPFAHPVSMCVSDVSFTDYRLQFSAYDFLQTIRRWFDLNSIGELHERNRPLEVFYISKIVAMIKDLQSHGAYGSFTMVSENTGILKFVDLPEATHYILSFKTDEVLSQGLAEIPKTIGDLKRLTINNGISILNAIEAFYSKAAGIDLPLLMPILVSQKRTVDSNPELIELFLIRFSKKIREISSQLKKLSGKKATDWLYSQPIEIIMTIPPISRDMNALSNGLSDLFRQVTFIGAGTLGGNIIDHFIRQGVSKKVVIIDNDKLLPHNIARHVLSPTHVMQSKVKAFKELYRDIEGQKIDSIDKDFLLFNDSDIKRAFEKAELIVDTSTSIAVERSLALDNKYGNTRRCSVFLNPKGTELILLQEDLDRNYRLDLLEMNYYRTLIINDRFTNHLEVSKSQVTNSFSCRSESAIMDYDNIGMLANVASQQLKKIPLSNSALLSIWQVSPNDSTIVRIDLPISEWDLFTKNGVKIYIISDVIEEMKRQRVSSIPNETGGVLFGCYDKDRQIIYVLFSQPAPNDSKRNPNSFVRGCDGLENVQDTVYKKTFYQVRYLGEWHTHPTGSNAPSHTDINQFKEMSQNHLSQDIPFVQAIIGNDGVYVNAVM